MPRDGRLRDVDDFVQSGQKLSAGMIRNLDLSKRYSVPWDNHVLFQIFLIKNIKLKI